MNRNKIEIQKIRPHITKNELILTESNSMLGISINSAPSVGNKAIAIFNFLNKKGLNEINLIIGDSVYRYTAMLKYKCSEAEGINIAKEESHQLMQFYKAHINDSDASYKLNFYPTSEIDKDDNFCIFYEQLWKLFESDALFRLSVHNFSKFYFERASVSIEFSEREKYIEFTYRYLIEELATCAILNQRGFNTLIYPGVIQTIYDVISMDHPYLTKLFKGYTLVSLRITRT